MKRKSRLTQHERCSAAIGHSLLGISGHQSWPLSMRRNSFVSIAGRTFCHNIKIAPTTDPSQRSWVSQQCSLGNRLSESWLCRDQFRLQTEKSDLECRYDPKFTPEIRELGNRAQARSCAFFCELYFRRSFPVSAARYWRRKGATE